MKHVLLSFCLISAALSLSTLVHFTRALSLDGDVATRTVIPSTLNCVPSTKIVALPSDRHEVHAVVVDMPQRASLEHASPETWGSLPTFDPPYEQSPYEQSPYEQSPATTVLQVAMN
jgi:hypothetical protein